MRLRLKFSRAKQCIFLNFSWTQKKSNKVAGWQISAAEPGYKRTMPAQPKCSANQILGLAHPKLPMRQQSIEGQLNSCGKHTLCEPLHTTSCLDSTTHLCFCALPSLCSQSVVQSIDMATSEKNFTGEEECQLVCLSFSHVSQDPIVENGKKGNSGNKSLSISTKIGYQNALRVDHCRA